MILSNYFKNKYSQLGSEIHLKYFKNQIKGISEIFSNYFKNKTQGVLEIIPNYFKNKKRDLQHSSKKVPDFLSNYPKNRSHRCPWKQKSSLKYFELLQKPDTKSPWDSFKLHTSETKLKGVADILSNCLKNNTRDAQDSFKLLQKTSTRGSQDSFKLFWWRKIRVQRDFFRLLQKENKRGPRDTFKALQ